MVAMMHELKKKKAQYAINVSREHEQAITQLAPQLFPMLLSQSGNLLYHQAAMYTDLKVGALKLFTETLATKATELNDQLKGSKTADLKHRSTDPNTLLKDLVTLKLPVLTHQQHSEHMALQTNFLAETGELIRRELAIAGAVASNELNYLKQVRIFCLNILSYLMEALGANTMELEAADPEDEAPSWADYTTSQPPGPKLSDQALPTFLPESVDGHKCRCLSCEPSAETNIVQEAKELIKSDYVAALASIDLSKEVQA